MACYDCGFIHNGPCPVDVEPKTPTCRIPVPSPAGGAVACGEEEPRQMHTPKRPEGEPPVVGATYAWTHPRYDDLSPFTVTSVTDEDVNYIYEDGAESGACYLRDWGSGFSAARLVKPAPVPSASGAPACPKCGDNGGNVRPAARAPGWACIGCGNVFQVRQPAPAPPTTVAPARGERIEVRGSFTQDGETEYGPWLPATAGAPIEPAAFAALVDKESGGALHARRIADEGKTWRRWPAPTSIPEGGGEAGEPQLHRCAIYLCDLCLQGAGGECHVPGCALWCKRAPDVPLMDLSRPTPICEPLAAHDAALIAETEKRTTAAAVLLLHSNGYETPAAWLEAGEWRHFLPAAPNERNPNG